MQRSSLSQGRGTQLSPVCFMFSAPHAASKLNQILYGQVGREQGVGKFLSGNGRGKEAVTLKNSGSPTTPAGDR